MYTVVFSVNTCNIDQLMSEKVGPNTNSKDVAMLHPARYVNPENLEASLTNLGIQSTHKASWLPGFLAGENIDHEHGHTFTAYGQKAAYLKATYASDTAAANDMKWLTVVTES